VIHHLFVYLVFVLMIDEQAILFIYFLCTLNLVNLAYLLLCICALEVIAVIKGVIIR
jgi:hypothetical protein